MNERTNTAKWLATQKRWQVNVQRDGKRRSFYSSKPGRTGQREANAKADAWLNGSAPAASGTIRVADAIDRYTAYLAELEALRRGETFDASRPISGRMLGNARPAVSLLNTWVRPALGHRKLSTLCDADVQIIFDAAAARGRSRKTIQDLRYALFSMLKYFRRAGAITYRPDDVTISPSARLKGKNIIQPEHMATLFGVDTTCFNRQIVVDTFIHAYRLQVLTGLRPGELIGLRWEDIDLENNLIHVRRSVNIYNRQTQGKNENAIRDIVLYRNARNELLAQRLLSGRATGSVFPIYSEKTYRNRLRKYLLTNGIPPVTPYELRHTFVSIAQDLPEGTLKAIIGHSKSMDTYGVYAHKTSQHNTVTAALLQEIFGEILTISVPKRKNVL